MAVSLQPGRVDLAHVVRQAGARPAVRSLESFRRDGPDGKALDVLRRQRGLGGYRCATTLEGGDYQILQVEAPDVPREERNEAVRWRIRDLIDYAPDAATLDTVEVPAAGSSRLRSLFVVCARNEVVARRMRLFDDARVPLEAIDVPEMALRNVAALWGEPGRAVALIAFDEAGGTLVIASEGELCASRRIEVSRGQLGDPDAGTRRASLERVGLELQRSFDHYDRQPGSVPVSALHVAGTDSAELADYLVAELPVPVKAAALDGVLDLSAVPALQDARRQGQCLVAIGLALRDDGVAP